MCTVFRLLAVPVYSGEHTVITAPWSYASEGSQTDTSLDEESTKGTQTVNSKCVIDFSTGPPSYTETAEKLNSPTEKPQVLQVQKNVFFSNFKPPCPQK